VHPRFAQASGITRDIIGAAIEVHKDKGPGLLESVYEWCLMMEVGMRGCQIENQSEVAIGYKQFQKTVTLRFDLLVNRCLLVEVKAVEAVIPIHKAQPLSYMKLLNIPLGLIINFNSPKLTDDVSRPILPGANLN
jgi:GxxExxY protein